MCRSLVAAVFVHVAANCVRMRGANRRYVSLIIALITTANNDNSELLFLSLFTVKRAATAV